MNNKNIKTALQLIIFLGIGIGLIYWKYNDMSVEEQSAMQQSFQQVNWIFLIPIAIIGFLSHFFRALRWRLLLEPIGYKVGVTNATGAVLVGYMANSLVPRLGEVAKCTILAKYESVPAEKAVGTIIAERAFDMLCLVIVMGLCLGLEYQRLLPLASKYGTQFFYDELGNFKSNLLVGLILGIIIMIFGLTWGVKRLKQNKLSNLIKGLTDGLKSILIVRSKLLFLLYSVGIWLMYTLMVYVGYMTLPETQSLNFASALAIIAFGSIGMIVTPGGIGTYPIIVAQVLTLYGINEGIGVAFGWICWGAQTVIVLLLGIISLVVLPILNKKRSV